MQERRRWHAAVYDMPQQQGQGSSAGGCCSTTAENAVCEVRWKICANEGIVPVKFKGEVIHGKVSRYREGTAWQPVKLPWKPQYSRCIAATAGHNARREQRTARHAIAKPPPAPTQKARLRNINIRFSAKSR